jgi:ribosomal protein S5
MTARGRMQTSVALVVTGNGAGLAGYAIAESPARRPMIAVVKAMAKASRSLVWIQRHEDRTIFHVSKKKFKRNLNFFGEQVENT